MKKATGATTMTGSKQLSWPQRVLAEHPALFISGIYFIASSIGLVYSWAFLRSFGINVFRYAEISDFLLASLKEPITWLLTALVMAMFALDNAWSTRVQRRGVSRFFRWYASERYRYINYLAAVFALVVFLFAYATSNENKVRDGEGEVVTVYLTDASQPKQLVMLGTTGRFIFLYDHITERVDIHPHESIMKITKSSPKRVED